MMEDQFLEETIKHAPDYVALQIIFGMVNSKRSSKKEEHAHSNVLNDLSTPVLQAADNKPDTSYSSDATYKIIAAVGGIVSSILVRQDTAKGYRFSIQR